MRRKLWVWLLTVVIMLAFPVIAMGEVGEKSWDINDGHIYGMTFANNGRITLLCDLESGRFGWARLKSAEGIYPEDMLGTWSVKRLDGDDVDIGVVSDGGASAKFSLNKGVAGQSADFRVSFSSDGLKNDVTGRVSVSIKSKNDYANAYAYDKTEHEAKTGKSFYIKKGHTLPERSMLFDGLKLKLEDTEKILENGHIELSGPGYGFGGVRGYILNPGEYKFTVCATLMDNVESRTVHTITVTGVPADRELEGFYLWSECDWYATRLSNDDESREVFIETFGVEDVCENDEIKWEFKQTLGPEVKFEQRTRDGGREVDLYVRGALPAGEYLYNVTATNVTRGDTDSEELDLSVEARHPGTDLPDSFEYKKIKDGGVVTIKSGKTLDFGIPTLIPENSYIPVNHKFNVWIEGGDELPGDMIAREDESAGLHILRATKEGSYKVHACLNMYDGSVKREIVFTLNVESAGQKVTEIKFKKGGNWENPLPIIDGEPTKIKVSVLPKNAKIKTLRWETDEDESDVSITQDGVVEASFDFYEDPVTFSVRAYATDGSGVSSEIVLRLLPRPLAEKVSLPKKLNMKVGETKTIKAKFKPKKASTAGIWESDNSGVAEVNDAGEVTAISAGTANIYVYATDVNGNGNPKVFAKCKVVIKQ